MSAATTRLRERIARPLPLLKHLVLRTEIHAYCAAIAFFALVAFYPLCTLSLWAAKGALAGTPAHAVMVETLREYYPQGQDFLLRNLEVTSARHARAGDLVSVVWILLGAAGVFVPLETAFNRTWRFPEHRPYWRNQAVGLLLTAACCGLAALFVAVTAGLHSAIGALAPAPVVASGLRYLGLRVVALSVSIAAIFLFYRFLPNGPVRAGDVFPAAVVAGVVAEAVRYAFLLALPLLDLQWSQGPYYVSVSFVLLAYFEAFVLVGGCFLAAPPEEDPVRVTG
ncbi:MAG TPA: YihY/virulence factor BrkB family protein [Vicinamibacteria bacterium]|nr:YihY/virulence factor BrkB family protein [Vicinamibacteria bacterium]